MSPESQAQRDPQAEARSVEISDGEPDETETTPHKGEKVAAVRKGLKNQRK